MNHAYAQVTRPCVNCCRDRDLAWGFFHEHLDRRTVLAAALVLAGGLVLAAPAGAAGWRAGTLVALACACWGLDNNLRERRGMLLHALTERDLGVTGMLGYEKAEVTAGGVPLADVDASALESRVAPGLWLCGEILDVEGRLGGFNFQWVWSSGRVAGRNAGR